MAGRCRRSRRSICRESDDSLARRCSEGWIIALPLVIPAQARGALQQRSWSSSSSLDRHSSAGWNRSFVLAWDRVARILRGFRPPSRGRVTSLDSGHPALRPAGQLRCSRRSCGAVRAQREVTKRKCTPDPRPPDILSCGCASGLRRFSERTSVYAGKPPEPARAAQGPREERRTFHVRRCRSRNRAEAKAPCRLVSFLGPSFPRSGNDERKKHKGESALWLCSSFCSCVCAHGMCAAPPQGPLSRGEWAEEMSRSDRAHDAREFFASTRMCCRKTP